MVIVLRIKISALHHVCLCVCTVIQDTSNQIFKCTVCTNSLNLFDHISSIVHLLMTTSGAVVLGFMKVKPLLAGLYLQIIYTSCPCFSCFRNNCSLWTFIEQKAELLSVTRCLSTCIYFPTAHNWCYQDNAYSLMCYGVLQTV